MRTRTLAIALIAPMLALSGGIVSSIATAQQQRVVGPDPEKMTLVKFVIAAKARNEPDPCYYFMLSTPVPPEVRLAFQFEDSKGASRSDVAHFQNVTIIKDRDANPPTGAIVDSDDRNQNVWVIKMTPDIYDRNSRCLTGIKVKN